MSTMNNNAPLSHEDVLLSSAQVERLLGLSRTSVWRLTRRGDLVPVYIDAALRFRRSDVLALMRVGTERTPTQVLSSR